MQCIATYPELRPDLSLPMHLAMWSCGAMLNIPPRSRWAQGVRASSRCRHWENVTAARVELRVPASQAGNPGAVGIDTNQKINQNRCFRTKTHVKEDVELTKMIGQLRQSPSDGGDTTRRPARPRRSVALLSIASSGSLHVGDHVLQLDAWTATCYNATRGQPRVTT